ncbi:WD40 repeat domain-containing protein [Oceanisphaera sp. DM8]|uniref:WD40 repeat domain-containing protein n=2 Tax=Oceanisphaera pacifica TaxID=2818389 RepID=A0ABS3NCP1_9GAMM|nr:WD40 repeat domain-containing protein [Oceanisphaera pacifica]
MFLLITGCDVADGPEEQHSYANGSVVAANTSDNGRFTLVAAGGNLVQVWQKGGNEPIYRWRQGEPSDSILLQAISPDNQNAATATETTVALWSLLDGKNQGFYQLKQPLRALALANNASQLLLGYQDGSVEFIDFVNQRRLLFMGHQQTERFAQDNPESASEVAQDSKHHRINAVDLSANGRYALTASQDGQVLVWQTTDAKVVSQWQHENSITVARLGPKGKLAFSGDAQGQGEIHALPSGKLTARLQVPYRGQTFVSARLNPDSKQLLTGSTSRRLELWQLDTGQLLQGWQVGTHTQLRPASAMVFDVAFINSRQVYSVSSSGLGEIWSLDSVIRENDE